MNAPPIGAHRLVGDGRSLALVTQDGEVDWWCAPELDDPPLLWSLLDPEGAAARWLDARPVAAEGRPAGPVVETVLMVGGRRIRCRDGLVRLDGTSHLLRLVRVERSEDGPAPLRHELSLGGFDRAWSTAGELFPAVISDGSSTTDGRRLGTEVVATADHWTGLAVAAAERPAATLPVLAASLDEAERRSNRLLGRARLTRHHPERAADALAVLATCTYEPTGAVAAAATTSLPEVPGADRQFDYRYCWLRDAGLAISVASLLGRADVAERYLSFLDRVALPEPDLHMPVVDVRGEEVPLEREVAGVRGWAARVALDRAVWIAPGWHPCTRRRHWRRARDEARERALGAIDSDGRLPQAHGQEGRTDAAALMVPLFGLLRGDDPRTARLIDATLGDLGVGLISTATSPTAPTASPHGRAPSCPCRGGRWAPWPSPAGWMRPALAVTSSVPVSPPC